MSDTLLIQSLEQRIKLLEEEAELARATISQLNTELQFYKAEQPENHKDLEEREGILIPTWLLRQTD